LRTSQQGLLMRCNVLSSCHVDSFAHEHLLCIVQPTSCMHLMLWASLLCFRVMCCIAGSPVQGQLGAVQAVWQGPARERDCHWATVQESKEQLRSTSNDASTKLLRLDIKNVSALGQYSVSSVSGTAADSHSWSACGPNTLAMLQHGASQALLSVSE
jgi:hypothetical protein